jgi:glycosyltransferase involved in cell wall biosynthesis
MTKNSRKFSMCHLNILWPQDVGVLKKLAQEACALHEVAEEKNVKCDCLVVVNKRIWQETYESPYFTMIPVSVPYPPPFEGGILPFVVWRKIENILKKYDAVVTRWTMPTPTFLNTVRRQAVFTEHHTKELEEFATHKGYKALVRRFCERVFAPSILSASKGIIAVSNEIRRYEIDRAGCERPSMVMSNGISFDDVPFQPASVFNKKELDIAYVSSHFAPWHGLDRLLRGLQDWGNKKPRATLHLIGNVTKEQQDIIRNMEILDKVHIHGVLRGENFGSALAACNIAIGGLGLHRKGFKEHSELKTKEYAARGIPFAIAYTDPDFPNDTPWVLKLPSDESSIRIDELVKFAEQLSNYADLYQGMREFTEKNLDWKKRMEKLIEFVQENT